MFERSMYPQLPANFCFPFSNVATSKNIVETSLKQGKLPTPPLTFVVFVLVMLYMYNVPSFYPEV